MKRHLARVNKRLSAHSVKRAKKLRIRNEKLLRGRQQCANVLSKKVNKTQARTSQPQFEKTTPRVKNNKTSTFCEIKSRISIKTEEIPGPLLVLLPPRTEQVNYKSYSNKYPRNYPYRFTHTGAHKLEPRPRPHRPKLLFYGKAKVNKENELSIAKEPHYLNTTNPGHFQPAKMNSKIELGESAELPAVIFESDAETGEPNDLHPPTQAQENPAPGGPPTQDQQEKLQPGNSVNYFCCGKCGESCPTPDEVYVHLGVNHGVTGNFMFHQINAQGVTPITGIEDQPVIDPPVLNDQEAPAPGHICAQDKPVDVTKAPDVPAPENPEDQQVPKEPETPAPGPKSAQDRPEDATKAPGQWQRVTGSEKAWFNPSICQIDSSDEEDEDPEILAPGPEKAQERPVSTTEPPESKRVHPTPAPSSEEAASVSAPGGEVGGGTDKEPAIDEPLPKKKALEWERIKGLDHNKVNEEARLKANREAAEITAKVVKKNKDDTRRQNIKDATPGSAQDGARQETPPAKASPGTAKAQPTKAIVESWRPDS